MGKLRLVIAIAILATAISACGSCENEVMFSAAAPSGEMQAVVFARECGATVGFNTQMSILPTGQLPADVGNAVIVDGEKALGVRWLGAKTVEVTRKAPGNIHKQEAMANGIEIRYAK